MELDYVSTFEASVNKIFNYMIGVNIDFKGLDNSDESYGSMGVAVIIGIIGSFKGRIILDMTYDTARSINKKINQDDCDEENVLFYVSELANMIAGWGITRLNNEIKGLRLRLAPPSIFSGENVKITNPKMNAKIMAFDSVCGKINLNVAFEGG